MRDHRQLTVVEIRSRAIQQAIEKLKARGGPQSQLFIRFFIFRICGMSLDPAKGGEIITQFQINNPIAGYVFVQTQ